MRRAIKALFWWVLVKILPTMAEGGSYPHIPGAYWVQPRGGHAKYDRFVLVLTETRKLAWMPGIAYLRWETDR